MDEKGQTQFTLKALDRKNSTLQKNKSKMPNGEAKICSLS